jgi:4-hydroxy-tetrahydrodipicolinate synthase
MVRAFVKGDLAAALKLHEKYYPIYNDLFVETNPVPVKAALAMLGLMKEEYRLPLVPMSPGNRQMLRATLKACGVLK